MGNKTKLKIERKIKRKIKEYIASCGSDLMKDIIKVRLDMWELKTVYKIKYCIPDQWPEVVRVYRENKELRK